jgi:hypothetical protein
MTELKLPTTYRQVTIGQLSEYLQAPDEIGRVCAIARISREEGESLPAKTIKAAINHIDTVVTSESHSMQMIVKIGEKSYGFIPELEACTTGEFMDFIVFSDPANFKKCVVKLMCLMYRPITNRVGNRYEIERYDITRTHLYRDDIEQMSCEVLSGALAFFLNLRKELLNSFLSSLDRKIQMANRDLMKLKRKAGHRSSITGGRTTGSPNSQVTTS